MQHIRMTKDELSKHFDWNAFRIQFVALFLTALFRSRSVCLSKIAIKMDGEANKKLIPLVPTFIIASFPFLKTNRITLPALSADPRWEIWSTSMKLIEKNILFGYGLNTFIQAQNLYHMPVTLFGERVDCQHNIYTTTF